jgi:hypothetical protein
MIAGFPFLLTFFLLNLSVIFLSQIKAFEGKLRQESRTYKKEKDI